MFLRAASLTHIAGVQTARLKSEKEAVPIDLTQSSRELERREQVEKRRAKVEDDSFCM